MTNCNDPLLQRTPGDLVQFFQEVIPEYIGTYISCTDGSTRPAISIDNVPNDVKVQGFEIIIPGYPRIGGGIHRSTRYTHMVQYWDIDFVNWDSDKPGSLARKGEFFQMIQKVLLHLPRIASGNPITQKDPTRTLQRYSLTIKLSDGYRNL